MIWKKGPARLKEIPKISFKLLYQSSDSVGQVVLTSTSLSATFTGFPTSFRNWLPTTCKSWPKLFRCVSQEEGLLRHTLTHEGEQIHQYFFTAKAGRGTCYMYCCTTCYDIYENTRPIKDLLHLKPQGLQTWMDSLIHKFRGGYTLSSTESVDGVKVCIHINYQYRSSKRKPYEE